MYTVALSDRRRFMPSVDYEVSSLDEVPEKIKEYVEYLHDYDWSVDDFAYDIRMSITKRESVEYNKEEMFAKAETLWAAHLKKEEEKRSKDLLANKRRDFERLKKELGE